jgi:hypothetical protein
VSRSPGPAYGWLAELPVLVVSLAAFLALTFHQVALPGLHTDEALEVLPAMQLLRGQPVECFKDVCIDLFGLRLPVMIYEYIATVNTYMAIPFFAVLGISVPALRTMAICQSAVAIVFLYLLARELFNRRVAMVAVLLIAVSPSFVFWSRQGVFVTSVTIPIALAATWAWLKWWRGSKSRYLFVGSFLFGLGLSAKFLFLWLIAGLGGAFLILNLDRIALCIRTRSLAPLGLRLRWRDAAIGGLLFLLGLLPLIVFNVKTMSTIHYVLNNVSSSSYYNVDNARVGVNLRERVKQLRSVLNGETFWYLSINPYASWRYPSVFLAAVGILLFSVFATRRQGWAGVQSAWATVAAVVGLNYMVLLFLPMNGRQWYVWLPAMGLAATTVTSILLLRGKPALAWARQYLIGIGASLFTMLFAYLAWKLAQWQVWSRAYVAAVIGLALAPLLRAGEEWRKILLPVLVVAVMLGASVFTPTALWFTHLAILTPWPILAIAAAGDLVARRSGLDGMNLSRLRMLATQPWARHVSVGLLALLALAGMLIYDDLQVDVAYHRELRIIGGKGDHTQASYTLVQYLEDHGMTRVVAMDWGIQDVVQFLSQGEINPPEVFGYERRDDVDEAFAIRVRQLLDDPQVVYVFRVQPHFLNRWERFQALVQQDGKRLVEEKVIYDWSAMPIFRLVRVTG